MVCMSDGRRFGFRAGALFVVAALALVPSQAAGASSDQDLLRTILTSSDRSDRQDAARALADDLDPAPIRKLVAKADDNRRASSALELIEQRVARRAARGRDLSIRRRAIRILGVIDLEASADDLARIVIEVSQRKVRNAAARALGQLEEAGPLVVDTLIEASTASFDDPGRQAAIERAVAAIGSEAIDPLLSAFNAGDYDTRLQTIQLLKAIERKHASALNAVWPNVVENLITRIGQAGTEDLAGLLAEIGSPAVPRLIEVARQPSGPGGPFDDPPSIALMALTTMAERDRSLIASLDEALERRDLALIADLMTFYISLGTPGSEQALIAALDALGNTGRAQIIVLQFLDSGHQPLVDAAYAWAERHGYTITGQSPGIGTWGTIQAG